MKAYPKIELRTAAADRVLRGHPWVFKDGLAKGLRCAPGDPVTLVSALGEPLANALADPNSDLAARVFAPPDRPIDETLLAERIRTALEHRAEWGVTADTDSYRWVHGENDFLPGFTVDRYGSIAVVKLDGPYDRWLEPLSNILMSHTGMEGVLFRGEQPQVLKGTVPGRVIAREYDIRLPVDVFHGQKTGLFLDQRENRAWVRRFSGGKSVLNLFAYTGGFSLAALAGGAQKVTSVDIAAPALALADEGVTLNGFDSKAHESVTADCYDFLQTAAKQGRTWDVVILDPPSLAHSQSALPKAQKAYARLNTAALRVVEPGGLFCTASCTSRVTPDMFRDIVRKAAFETGRSMQIIREAGAGADHPVALGFPEGSYLKFMALQRI